MIFLVGFAAERTFISCHSQTFGGAFFRLCNAEAPDRHGKMNPETGAFALLSFGANADAILLQDTMDLWLAKRVMLIFDSCKKIYL